MLAGHRISTWPTSWGPLCWKGPVPGAFLGPLILCTWLLISLALGIGTLPELGHTAALLASVPLARLQESLW